MASLLAVSLFQGWTLRYCPMRSSRRVVTRATSPRQCCMSIGSRGFQPRSQPLTHWVFGCPMLRWVMEIPVGLKAVLCRRWNRKWSWIAPAAGRWTSTRVGEGLSHTRGVVPHHRTGTPLASTISLQLHIVAQTARSFGRLVPLPPKLLGQCTPIAGSMVGSPPRDVNSLPPGGGARQRHSAKSWRTSSRSQSRGGATRN
mmetsp:Transcript_144680/g.463577  ORF Transcript_144680/g.463577 Transcript_144680/m.463577 type:complete len:200 (+) Transcript_144680:530-1129(+)